MNNYLIYGINISSNIPIRYVEESKGTPELFLNVKFSDDINKEFSLININENNKKLEIDLKPFAVYTIDFDKNEIICVAQDYESFYSTFFNIPFSCFLIFKKELMLHSSSMLFKDELICFTGDKGVGKSTLTHLLNGSILKQYTDDTLRIDENKYGHKGNNLTKLKIDTVELLNVKLLTGHFNAVGKRYVELDTKFLPYRVKAIVYIERNGTEIGLKKLESKIAQQTIIFKNIVGVNYFSAKMVKFALEVVNKTDFPIYILNVPNDMKQLMHNKDKIMELIINGVFKRY